MKKIVQVFCLLIVLMLTCQAKYHYDSQSNLEFQSKRREAVAYFNQVLEEKNQQIREEAQRKAEEELKRQALLKSRSTSVKRETYSYVPGQYLGVFASTAYCTENYHHICNDGDATKTAMGTPPIPYKTIAVDPTVIPLGTKLVIKDSYGSTYHVVATDTGGAIKGKKIDMVCPTHKDANIWGRRSVEIWIAE